MNTAPIGVHLAFIGYSYNTIRSKETLSPLGSIISRFLLFIFYSQGETRSPSQDIMMQIDQTQHRNCENRFTLEKMVSLLHQRERLGFDVSWLFMIWCEFRVTIYLTTRPRQWSFHLQWSKAAPRRRTSLRRRSEGQNLMNGCKGIFFLYWKFKNFT